MLGILLCLPTQCQGSDSEDFYCAMSDHRTASTPQAGHREPWICPFPKPKSSPLPDCPNPLGVSMHLSATENSRQQTPPQKCKPAFLIAVIWMLHGPQNCYIKGLAHRVALLRDGESLRDEAEWEVFGSWDMSSSGSVGPSLFLFLSFVSQS
jgi:hypothetical protein